MDVNYKIRRSKKAKRIILKVNHQGLVEVVVPWRVAARHGEKFLRQRVGWVAKVQQRLQERRAQVKLPQISEAEARAKAQAYFGRATAEMAGQLGLPAPAVKIATFRSQWGSCNRRKGLLKFSWRLALAPEAVAHYVAAHEVAHLVHPNHSKRFWQLVGQLDPPAPSRLVSRAWLRGAMPGF